MSVISSKPWVRTPSHRQLLLAGASLLSLLAAAPVQAADILRSNPTISAPIAAMNAATAASQAAAAAAARAQNSLTRTTQALQALQAAQGAARAAALAMPSTVPNGLGVGGLQVVDNPVAAAQDTTGTNTWQGADAPTQTTDSSGHADVTVQQTDSRAILSWKSYNVGKDTTLTYNQKGNADWIALNRVVGADAKPSQILGQIKSDGTVLVINQNGIIFGGTSQINTNTLIASTLDVGAAMTPAPARARTIVDRNQQFLADGLLGFGDTLGTAQLGDQTFSATSVTGAVEVQSGAQITSGDGGYILLTAATVKNSGALSATDGQVILAAGDALTLTEATGADDSLDPNLRGLVAIPHGGASSSSAINDADGLIQSTRGSIFLGTGAGDTTVNQGGLFSSTSISRNGAIEISGANIQIAPGSVIAITADDTGGTIPQDPTSLGDFKHSTITIGNLENPFGTAADTSALVDIGADSLIYAPSGDIAIGASPGAVANQNIAMTAQSRIFIDAGATIDASGLKDVVIPASRNQIQIGPLKGNELADSPAYKNSFLNGATVTVDPRLSGVRDDGVAWIGSPLIDAKSYQEQVGVSASELMTTGGNVTLGVNTYTGIRQVIESKFQTPPITAAPDVIVKAGAAIDISGGWVTYQGGTVKTTQLLTSDGRVVDIGSANLTDNYVGIFAGNTINHASWGVSETFGSPFRQGGHVVQTYTEGRDAGSLTIKGSAAVLDGTIFGQAFAGPQQLLSGQRGTGTSSVFGDMRPLQAANSQMPAGGFLSIQALGEKNTSGNVSSNDVAIYAGGGDIVVKAASDYLPLASDFAYGQSFALADDGTVAVSTRDPSSFLSDDRLSTITLSDATLSDSGLSQVSLHTTGAVTVAANADVTLNPGGVFDVLAGRTVTIDGKISTPSGAIVLQTFGSPVAQLDGSVFAPALPTVGSFDIIINGTLSTRGLWTNDFGKADADLQGNAWTDGGSITLYAAPLVVSGAVIDPSIATGSATVTDISGGIYINSGSLVDVSGGGYVGQLGALDLTAHGGNLSLYDETSYFQLTNPNGLTGGLDGFRVNGQVYQDSAFGANTLYLPINPDQMNSRVVIDPSAIRAQGFAGGGTFTLTTPEFTFGSDTGGTATELPLDFFSTAGFANYNITSYKTDLIANPFNNGLGGTDAILATQTLTVGAGQTLALTQSMLPSVLTAGQAGGLRNLASGGDLFSVLTPSVPGNDWDSRPVNLTLSGLLELDVAAGGSITGAAGASLTVSKLLNEGTIRLPGGTITQREVLPTLYDGYSSGFNGLMPLGIHALSDIFSVNPDGTISENAASTYSADLTNAQVAGAGNPVTQYPIYFLGKLDAQQGVVLAPGSVTDLSGTSIRNPYAIDPHTGAQIDTGRMVAGGSLVTDPRIALSGQSLFRTPTGSAYAALGSITPAQTGRDLILDPGATLNLSGASDTYDLPSAPGALPSTTTSNLVPTAQWSDAGTLSAGAGFTLTGAAILAQGGAPQAAGGTLSLFAPVLTQHDDATPGANTVSADMIANAGFSTLTAIGSVDSSGDVALHLDRGFFLEGRAPTPDEARLLAPLQTSPSPGDALLPTIRTGGRLEIDAPYIALTSNLNVVVDPKQGDAGTGSVVFNAGAMDITGAVLFDQSVADVQMNVSSDLRLIGAQAWQTSFGVASSTAPPLTQQGALAVNGNLTINAAQVYPTTGSTFTISSTAGDGTIAFGRTGTTTPATPYSAGGNLTVEAANIVQGGVLRAPLGTLTLGTTSADTKLSPATQSLVLADGGITSVSANGLVIPYGTTTDQIEWFYTPTNTDPLSAPPAKTLNLAGGDVDIQSGATVDISGGGDIYAYEFVPGTGGTRDVLDRLNPDIFTGNNGYQYADQRQVYAIVPGLSNAPAAAFDPVYSSDYANLSSASGVGSRVYLSGGNGLAAGWYTLLPAKYALLPGGMRVVEETGAKQAVPGLNQKLKDGTLMVSGSYGDALSGTQSSAQHLFTVQSQAAIAQESKIVQTTGNNYFTAQAAHAGVVTPQLPQDAGRLVINPGASLIVDSVLSTAAATGGRGAQVDIGGSNFTILASLPQDLPQDGVLRITAASLSNLHADSLLVGGTRTDNADGSTKLNVTAQNITVQNDANSALSAGEIVMAANQQVTVADGAAITAVGTQSDTRTGAYQIGAPGGASGAGALLRVANGPERLVSRTNTFGNASLNVGAATLSGTAVMLDSSGGNTLSSNLTLTGAKFVALGGPRIGFGVDAGSYDGLAIDGALENLLNQGGARVTLRSQSSIDFAAGIYNFGDVRLDAGALTSADGGDVTLNADTMTLGNAGGSAAPCAGCAGGTFAINAGNLLFGDGAISAGGFTNVALSASKGIFAQGAGGALDAGAAALTIHTPYIGDNAPVLAAGQAVTIPSLMLTSTGAVVIDNAAQGTNPTVTGIPGAKLTINGASVSVSGTKLHATAGAVAVNSDSGIALANGATVEAPGYTKVFGESVDPVSQDAPGGRVTLNAKNGDIDLGAGTLVSVGGGTGVAGTLELFAQKGTINFGGTIDGHSPDGAGSLTIDTRGAFDLAVLGAAANANGFTNTLDIRTQTGDLTLAQGQSLTADSVRLTADGGALNVAGTINTSGTNGGNVDLYGAGGVTLAASAVIDTHAVGYTADDTRQAHAGNVTLGTIGTGAIAVADGARIDVSVARSGDRLVPYYANNVEYYNYVAGDTPGTVTFRAPVIEQAGADTVHVSVASASSIVGAGAIVVEGVKTWDLRALAAIANSGVTVDAATNTATIDPRGDYFSNTATADGLVPFIQTFAISADNANLGGLASSAVFHARPGVALAFDGNIELDRNWNLAAGTVDIAGATAAGLMATQTFNGVGGASVTTPYVLPGADAALFANYVSMVYRTDGGNVYGEAPDIALQASGNLTLNASINDGFFQFRDQTNADYLAALIPASTATVFVKAGWDSFIFGLGSDGVFIGTTAIISTTTAANMPQSIAAPYSAVGNSVSPDKVGDPFGSAALFPLLPSSVVASSSSLELVTGADLARAGGLAGSADPLALDRASSGTLSLGGSYTYSYGGSAVSIVYGGDFSVRVVGGAATGSFSSSATWLSDVLAKSATVSPNIVGGQTLNYGTVGGSAVLIGSGADAKKMDQPGDLIFLEFSFDSVVPVGGIKPKGTLNDITLRDIAKISDPGNPQYDAYLHNLYISNATTPTADGDFFTAATTNGNGNPYTSNGAYLVVSLKTAAYILQKYVDPLFNGSTGVSTATVTSLVRTGVGAINVAASGDVNLQGTATPVLQGSNQLGGAAIYTAGHPADTSLRTVLDPDTGAPVTIDPAALLQTGTNFSTKMTYDYGNLTSGEVNPSGAVGVLVADPVTAEGGGDVSVTAGGDVLGRRDTTLAPTSTTVWAGSADEPWRSGAVGINTYARIDPQLYHSGVGALGGGDITVRAGGDIFDLAVTATDSLATANATGGNKPTQALMTFGGGNVSISAGNDILGGQVDVASGTGHIAAGGDIASAGKITTRTAAIDNLLRLHTSDATVAISAVGSAVLQGVSAAGPQQLQSGYRSNLNADALYSPHAGLSIVANSAISIANENDGLLTPLTANGSDFNFGLITDRNQQLVYPGSFEAASLNGDLTISGTGTGTSLLLMPSAQGQLQLLAGGTIGSATIAMLDAEPGLLPGLFSIYSSASNLQTGAILAFPAVLPTTSDQARVLQHASTPTHQNDTQPVRVYAGGDIGGSAGGLILSVPKQARIEAGQDIINMMFFGQNLAASDITRITAGRDITATTQNVASVIGYVPSPGSGFKLGPVEPALQGNTFVIGGPGNFMLEAGRDLGPFLNSATATIYGPSPGAVPLAQTLGGGILSVGNEWNPWLPDQGADLTVMFGVAKGINYSGFQQAYLDPANLANMPDYLFAQVKVDNNSGGVDVSQTVADRSKPIYAPLLIQWMQQNNPVALLSAFGTTAVNYEQAYAAFAALPGLTQRAFLNQIYFNELRETDDPFGPSYHQYGRGYQAVNTLFPASYGYTANDLTGGSNGANAPVVTGNLDLRLATIQTARGGDIDILGPGGRVLAGSTVATAQQAARRTYDGARLYAGYLSSISTFQPAAISAIPSGYEGVLTLRGGAISTFTDGDFLLNQSRLFTEQGGQIEMWSSNADLNAGQGPKTSANFPPVEVRVDQNAYSELNQAGATTGAGIAALQATPDSPPSDVYLMAPRGTVDFGDAGVRVSGSIFVAAAHVANADNLQVSGQTFGVPKAVTVDTAGLAAASNAAAAGAQTAVATRTASRGNDMPSLITVEVLGYGGGDADDERKKRLKP